MIVRVFGSNPPDELSGLEVGEAVEEGPFVDDVGLDDVDMAEEELWVTEELGVEDVAVVEAAAPSTEAIPPTCDMKPSRLFVGAAL